MDDVPCKGWVLVGALLTAWFVFLQVLHARALLIAHRWVGDRPGWPDPCSGRILCLFRMCYQRSDLTAEGPSWGCCAAVALVLLTKAQALLPGQGLRWPGCPVGQQISSSWSGGPSHCGPLASGGLSLPRGQGCWRRGGCTHASWFSRLSGGVTPDPVLGGADEGRGRII